MLYYITLCFLCAIVPLASTSSANIYYYESATIKPDILTNQTKIKDFDDQVMYLMQNVRINRYEAGRVSAVCEELQDVFQKNWPGSKVFSLGSLLTGQALRGSDVDCYAVIPGVVNPSEDFVTSLAKDISEYPTKFVELTTTIKTNPLIIFYYLPMRQRCSVILNEPVTVEDGQLMSFLFNNDKRILTMSIIVKYWSKVQGINAGYWLPSYSLNLLILFYCQQIGLLPSIAELQMAVEPQILEGWNVAFGRHYKYLYPTCTNLTLYEILGRFFVYYSEFDFEEYALSPYLGYPLRKGLFLNLKTVPVELGLYKENCRTKGSPPFPISTKLSIQEPFRHNKNGAIFVNPVVVERMISSFKYASKMYTKLNRNEFLKDILTPIE